MKKDNKPINPILQHAIDQGAAIVEKRTVKKIAEVVKRDKRINSDKDRTKYFLSPYDGILRSTSELPYTPATYIQDAIKRLTAPMNTYWAESPPQRAVLVNAAMKTIKNQTRYSENTILALLLWTIEHLENFMLEDYRFAKYFNGKVWAPHIIVHIINKRKKGADLLQVFEEDTGRI